MLGTLQHIVQQVNEAANLDEALAIVVSRVKEAMAVDVCSVCIKNVTTGDPTVPVAGAGRGQRDVRVIASAAKQSVTPRPACRAVLPALRDAKQ